MIAITGITGNIGSQLARILISHHQPVRAIARDRCKAQAQLASCTTCEVVQADIHDAPSLTAAFTSADAVFILVPPIFDPQPGFPEAHAIAANLTTALLASRPAHTVYLSTIGAQAIQENLLTQHTIIETALRKLPLNITFLRPAWFMENASWDIAPARETGVIPSFLHPLTKPVPMVATADIATVAAQLLEQPTSPDKPQHRIVELEGHTRITPNQIAAAFTRLLGRPIAVYPVPRDSWQSLFASQGMHNSTPRMQMLDGFNQGWIEFENPAQALKGVTPIEAVLQSLLSRESN